MESKLISAITSNEQSAVNARHLVVVLRDENCYGCSAALQLAAALQLQAQEACRWFYRIH